MIDRASFSLGVKRFTMVNSLPPELLTQILLASLPKNWGSSRPFATRLAVSHVCRYWRDVALGRASLWTTLFFNIGDASRFARKIEWIERYRGELMNIVIEETMWTRD